MGECCVESAGRRAQVVHQRIEEVERCPQSCRRRAQLVERGQLAVLSLGDGVTVEGGAKGGRLILVAGRPLREPVAKYGPFVMNTPDEIRRAIADYQAGKFV